MTALLLAVLLAAPAKHKVLVLDVKDSTGKLADEAKTLTQLTVSEVAQFPHLDVISSAEINTLLGVEKQKQLTGCTDNSNCMADLGGALGARYVISGQVGRIGKRYRLDVRVLNAEKARILASEGDFAADDKALTDTWVTLVRIALTESKLAAAPGAGGKEPSVITVAPAGPAAAPEPTPSPAPVPAAEASSKLGGMGTGELVCWSGTAAAAVGAAVMTFVTWRSYRQAVADYAGGPGPSAAGASLRWKAATADILLAGAVGFAAGGTFLHFSAAPTVDGEALGAQVALAGRF